jgi:hypothetical protein
MPSVPGLDDVSDEPPFVSLQFTVLEVLNALLAFDINKGPDPDGVPPLILNSCSSTGHWRLVFFLIGGSSVSVTFEIKNVSHIIFI